MELVFRFVQQKSVKDTNQPEFVFGEDIHQMMQLFLTEAKRLLSCRSGRFDDYYAWVEIGDPSLPLVGIVGHIDMVDYVRANWEYNPLGEFDGDTMYGRGVVDNKGPIVQALYAMKYVQENELPLRIRLLVGADEESDFTGIKKYIENQEEVPDYGFVPDAKFPYILSEKGIINMTLTIDEATFGRELKEVSGGTGINITPDYARAVLSDNEVVEETGVAAHVANDSTDDNAIVNLLSKLAEEASASTFLEQLKRMQQNNHLLMKIQNHDIVLKPTFISQKESRIELTLDTRIAPELCAEAVKEEILRRFGLDEEHVVRVNLADGYEYGENHPVVRLMDKVYRESIHELRPELEMTEPLRIGGTTYGKYFKNCIVFGPGFPKEHSYAHREDERISVKSFMDGAAIYIRLLEAFVDFDASEL